jgi:ABC-type phosphate transport system substrate-binding protein
MLLQPTVRLSYKNGNSNALTQFLTKCKKTYAYDYALTAYLPDNISYTEIMAIPFFLEGVAIVYNFPELANGPVLNFSRSLLSKIFRQEITSWNHSLFANTSINPGGATIMNASNRSITLVLRADISGTTRTLLDGLRSFDPANWTVNDLAPVWPMYKLSNNLSVVIAKDQFSAASYVLTTPGAIGYAPFNLVDDAGLPVANIINQAGKIAPADNTGLSEGVKALGRTVLNASSPVDAPGNKSYPLITVEYLLVHTQTTDCETYRAMFRFWYWALNDNFASALIVGLYGYMQLTPDLLTYSNSVLQSFQCNGKRILEEEYVDVQLSILKQIMICISGICIMFTVSVLATLGYKRRSRITKAAGLAFAVCFLVGCLFNYLSVFFWAIASDADSICRARYSFAVLGYSLILGAMFSKSWEINKVFVAGESGVVNPFQEVPWWQFCRVFFSIVGTQAVLLIIWMSVDGPRASTVTIDAINFQAVHQCTAQRPKVWLALEAVYFVLLLLWGAYLAYETRDVWLKYNYPNESRSILLSIYNLAFCGIILVPLITTLDVSPETLFFLVAIAILWPTSFALFSVYMPKLAKFLGSSYRNSGNSKGAQSIDKERSHTHSVGSHVKGLVEHDQEQKLLDAEKRRKGGDLETPRPGSPDSHRKDPASADFSPDSRVRNFHKGTERTESTDDPQWRTLLTSPSGEDIHETCVEAIENTL